MSIFSSFIMLSLYIISVPQSVAMRLYLSFTFIVSDAINNSLCTDKLRSSKSLASLETGESSAGLLPQIVGGSNEISHGTYSLESHVSGLISIISLGSSLFT